MPCHRVYQDHLVYARVFIHDDVKVLIRRQLIQSVNGRIEARHDVDRHQRLFERVAQDKGRQAPEHGHKTHSEFRRGNAPSLTVCRRFHPSFSPSIHHGTSASMHLNVNFH